MTMGIARSSVTKAINVLEIELGTRLLDRTTRSVSLSLDGSRFLGHCLTVLDAFDETHAMFAKDATRPSGRVRIGLPSRVGRGLVAPALPDFFERYPEVQLELCVSDRQADLVREGFDCVLRVGEKTDSEPVSRKLADLRQVTCASPAYIEKFGFPRLIRDLDGHLAVGYQSPFTGRVGIWHHRVEGERQEFQLHSIVTANSAEMDIACCEAGLGLIQVPAFDVQDALADGTLVEVLQEASAGSIPATIVYAHRRNLTPRVKVLMDSKLLREAPSPDSRKPARTH